MDHNNTLCPPAWRGVNLLGKTLQIVRQRLRDRAPPQVRHHHTSPPRGYSPAQDQDYIFELEPSSQQSLPICDTAPAPSGYPALSPHVPPNHDGDVSSMTIAAGHMAQNAQPLVEQGPYHVSGIVSIDNSTCTTKIKISGHLASAQFGCVALLNTGSPRSFITRNAWEHMV